MFDAAAMQFALTILLQSTLLITVGLLAARWCGGRKPVIQSAILRVTLAAVLLCPLASLTLSKLGIGGFGLLPAWDARDENVRTASAVAPAESATEPDAGRPQFATTAPVPSDEAFADPPAGAMADVLTARPGVNPLPAVATAPVPNVNETAAVSVPSSSTVSSWPGFLNSLVAWCWIAGATLLVVRIVCANIVVARLRRSSSAAAPEIVELCRATAQTLGLSAPRVRVSPRVHSPCLVGVRKPVILLPDQRTFTPQTLRDVLLHELAHLSRRDCAFQFLSRIATALLFFQPLVWVLSRRLEQIADDVCDDHVVQFGTDRKRYAHALVDVADNFRPQWAVASAGVGVFSLKSSLSRRVQRILDSSRSLTLQLHVGGIVLIVLLGLSATTAAAFAFSGNSELTGESETPEATAPSQGEGAEEAGPQAAESNPSPRAPRRSAARPGVAAQPTGAEVTRDPFQFEGRVLDPDGQPVPGAKISLFRWQSPGDSEIATTDDRGEFDFEVAPADDLHARISENSGILIATADGFGLAIKPLHECETTGALAAAFQQRIGSQRVTRAAEDPVFQLVPDDLPVSGRIVDIQGRPVAGARVRVSKVTTTGAEQLDAWEDAAQQPNADYYSLQRYAGGMLGGDAGGTTLDCIPEAVTDDNGQFVLQGVGRDRIVKLLISGPGIETNEVHARTRMGEDIEITKNPRNPGLGMILYHPANFLHVAGPSQAVEGVVSNAKSGQPIAGVTIQSHQLAGRRMAGWTEGIVRTVTDAEGRYRLEGLPLGENRVLALSSIDEPYLVAVFAARTNPGDDPLALDIELTRGIWIHGRAFDVSTSEPIRTGRLGYYAFTDNPHAQAVAGFNGAILSTRYRLNPDGTYRIPGLPGRGIVSVMADRDHEKYRRGQGSDAIEGLEPNLNGFRTYPTLLSAFNYHVLAEVNPTEEQEDVEVDLLFDSGRTLTVSVVDEDGNPVTSGLYTGMMEFNSWRSMNSDRIEVYGYQPDEARRVQVIHQERKLAGFLLVTGEDPGNLTITLAPWAEIRGRLLDSAGIPKANAQLSDVYQIVSDDAGIAVLPPGENWQVGKTFTDEDGRFSFAGLVPNQEYTLSASEQRKDGIGYYLGEIPLDFTLEPGEVRDLGDVRLPERGAQ